MATTTSPVILDSTGQDIVTQLAAISAAIAAGSVIVITASTQTNLNGVLSGNGSTVGAKALDTVTLTNDNDHVPTSGVVKSAINKLLRVIYIEPTFTNGYATYDMTTIIANEGLSGNLRFAMAMMNGSGVGSSYPAIRACDWIANTNTLKIALTSTASGTYGVNVIYQAY